MRLSKQMTANILHGFVVVESVRGCHLRGVSFAGLFGPINSRCKTPILHTKIQIGAFHDQSQLFQGKHKNPST